MGIEAVVFDLGRVLINWDPEGFYDRVIGPERRRALFAEVPLYRANAAVDRGAPFRKTIYDLADDHPAHAAEIRLWHDRWLEMASPAIEGSAVLLQALRAQDIPVYALTNFGTEPLAVADRAYPVLRMFDQRFVSGALGVSKPGPRIYEILEEQTGHPPETLLFTDDTPENIAAAHRRGWHTQLFKGPGSLATRLVAEGLLPDPPL